MEKMWRTATNLMVFLTLLVLATIGLMGKYWLIGDSRGVFIYGGIFFMLSGIMLYVWKSTVFPNEEVEWRD